MPLTNHQQELLLRLAREAVEESVRRGYLSKIAKPLGAPEEACGAFVTLRHEGRLRGCIGHLERLGPLYETVRECAMAAALHDPRFDSVEPEELPGLSIEISVLSPLRDIAPDEIVVGEHGLMVSQGPFRGLLLPQVAVEWNWDRERFLEETCHKAGLPSDAWRHGARVQGFSAQVFAEPLHRTQSSHHAA